MDDGSPQIHMELAGEPGAIKQSTVITVADYDAFTQLAAAVAHERGYDYEGCVPAAGLSESVSLFAGDAGWEAGIEGCDDPLVVQLRELAVDLVTRYFASE
jgi:hypothetical protein